MGHTNQHITQGSDHDPHCCGSNRDSHTPAPLQHHLDGLKQVQFIGSSWVSSLITLLEEGGWPALGL